MKRSRLTADCPKVWPQPTESLATQEETGESALQASLRSLAEARQIPAKFRRFCYACGSTGQFTYVAKLSGFLDTLSVPACCTEHKASATLLHLQTGDAKGQER